jgi:hypothetical protein
MHISKAPPVFSTQELVKKFLIDGLMRAISDREIYPNEERWLRSVARDNNIKESWLVELITNIMQLKEHTRHLEVEKLKIFF